MTRFRTACQTLRRLQSHVGLQLSFRCIVESLFKRLLLLLTRLLERSHVGFLVLSKRLFHLLDLFAEEKVAA